MCGLADWVRQCLVEFVFTVQPDPPVAAPSRAGPPEVVAQTADPPVIDPHGADPPWPLLLGQALQSSFLALKGSWTRGPIT